MSYPTDVGPSTGNEVPPFLIQDLVSAIEHDLGTGVSITCAQALGTEVYVGCSNGQLMRYALQANNPDEPMRYDLVSRQNATADRPIDEIVLVPSIFRALIFADHQLSIYTLPSFEMTNIKPIRNAIAFAVDQEHLKRPAPSNESQLVPVALSIIKRSGIALFTLSDRLYYQNEVPFQGGTHARRIGHSLCVADKEFIQLVNLEESVAFPIIPLNQVGDGKAVKPFIVVISDEEYLVLSWMGASTLGVFMNTSGDPVRGTLQFESYPESICMDYPYIITMLPNNTIVIHNVETQNLVQTLPVPETIRGRALVSCLDGYLVPSNMGTDKMRKTPVRLLREQPSI